MKKKKILQILKWVYLTVLLVGAGWYLSQNYADVKAVLKKISLQNIVLCALSLIAGKLVLADVTRLSLKKNGDYIDYKEAFAITSISQLGKYLPGGIWHFVGKFGIYKARSIDNKKGIRAMIWENAWLLSGAGVIGFMSFIFIGNDAICALIPFSCFFNRSKHFLWILPIVWIGAMLLFELIIFQKINVSDFLITVAEQILAWVLLGLSLYFIFPIGRDLILSIIGAFSLSWAGGYIAVFAPGGIGVRELLLSLILESEFSSVEITTFASAHRLIWVVIEFVLGGISTTVFPLPTQGKKDE